MDSSKVTLTKLLHGKHVKRSEATFEPLHPCQYEDQCSVRNDVNHSPTTYKGDHQKSSIIRGLLNSSIKAKIMGGLGRSLEDEAF